MNQMRPPNHGLRSWRERFAFVKVDVSLMIDIRNVGCIVYSKFEAALNAQVCAAPIGFDTMTAEFEEAECDLQNAGEIQLLKRG